MFIQELIDKFDESQYNNENNINMINNFITKYKDIEISDTKKPMFSLTKKYNTYKLKKKESKKKKNVWKQLVNKDEDDKIKTEIKSNLNKISDEVHKNIIIELKKILLKSNNIEILHYFIDILYNKIIHDKKFQLKYIEILEEIYKYDKIYLNYTEIRQDNDKKYIWRIINNKEVDKKFDKKSDCIKDIRTEMNLYKLLLKVLNKEYKKRDEYIQLYEEEDDDEKEYKLKRKYIGVYEILRILYNNGKIPIDIIICVISRLLKYSNINYDIECLHTLIIKCVPNKNKFIDKKILESIINKLKAINNSELKSRTKFLSYDIVDKFNEFSKLSKSEIF
jgi:hypothetical protein